MMEMREIPSTLIYNLPKRDSSSSFSLPPNSSLQLQQQPTRDPDPSSSSSPPPPPIAAAATVLIRYRECLRNHAASMGGHVTDGCGEFMPNGEQGTPESLICAACECHRNFHRKEQPQHVFNNHNYYHSNKSNRIFHPSSLHHHHHQHGFSSPGFMMGPAAESSSEDLNMFQPQSSKKRFRTKFTQDQKKRMMEFAENLGWKILKQDEEGVKQFCSHVGIQRQVFKVWMHNSKQAMKKKKQIM